MNRPYILHLSTNDFGGAGLAALKIYKLHKSRGLNVDLMVKHSRSNDCPLIIAKPSRLRFLIVNLASYFSAILSKIGIIRNNSLYSLFDLPARGAFECIKELPVLPDVIVLHWVAGFVGLKDIECLSKLGIKIFWFYMDMAPITGGCHFSYSCFAYKTGCQTCAPIGIPFLSILPRLNIKMKYSIFSISGLKIVPVNTFVQNQVAKSYLSRFASASPCYLPINSELYVPRKDAIHSQITLLFGGSKIDNPRKGGIYFLNALKIVDEYLRRNPTASRLSIILPGLSEWPALCDYSEIQLLPSQLATTSAQLVNLYQSANALVSCSIDDTGPMMVPEAMMCGLPVFAFPVGIATELVTHQNGFILERVSSDLLAKALISYIEMPFLDKKLMSHAARSRVLSLCSEEAHISQFNSLIS